MKYIIQGVVFGLFTDFYLGAFDGFCLILVFSDVFSNNHS
jgi:hypothetical protein